MDDDIWDDASDSDASSIGGGDDAYARYDDIVSRISATSSAAGAGGNALKWSYFARSERGGEVFGDLPKLRTTNTAAFKLEYNSTDAVLLEKAQSEIRHSLNKARLKLFECDDGQAISPAGALAAALPAEVLRQFHTYLKMGLNPVTPRNVKKEMPSWSFGDIVEFLRCEVKMRLFGCSKKELKEFGVDDNDYKKFETVRKALSKADVAPSERKLVAGNAAQLPACSFDPIIRKAIEACNGEWTDMFSVPGESFASVDDDKMPTSSPKWKAYGMRMTPTKDKKLKPVFHVAAVTGASYIVWMHPDTIDTTLADMLRKLINDVTPSGQEALRALICFFIDRGYLELAKAQDMSVTNLIQIMEGENVKFLGTLKDNLNFPFQIVDVHEGDKRVHNSRPIIQAYGDRTNFIARSGNIQASVLRHGTGKVRAARIATNLNECKQDTWVAETNRLMSRKEHEQAPKPLKENASRAEQIDHAWSVFLSGVIVLTLLQRTADWFKARMFCFSSTTFHVVVNVMSAVYLNTSHLRGLHQRCLAIICLKPRSTVTVENAAELEDPDVPSQRSQLVRIEGAPTRRDVARDKCDPKFWRRGNAGLAKLRADCNAHGVPHDEDMSRAQLADALAAAFRAKAEQRAALLLTAEVSDDDVESKRLSQVAFLQRMVPHWIMRPFQTKTGGPIDQGNANESQVIRRLKPVVKKFSQGAYDMQKVREFGLLANRKHRVCTSSPDGVFPLLKRNSQGTYDFVGLCVLEMKTRGTERTTDALIESALRSGEWTECVAGTPEFENAIPDNGYRTQVCQHATALSLEYVLMVYSVPGAVIKKIVLVRVSQDDRASMLDFQIELATRFMPFAYKNDATREIPSLGEDYSKAYGYAQDHHTLELDLLLWYAHTSDVMENGTPPPVRRFIDLPTNYWNKFMGNVDTVRKILERCKAVRANDSAPGSLLWFVLLGYIFYNAFRIYQHARLESMMHKFTTYKQFQKARKKITFRGFLFKLSNPDCLSEQMMQEYFPGLREQIDRGQSRNSLDSVQSPCSNMSSTPGARALVSPDDQSQYNRLKPFLEPGNPLNERRLDTALNHRPTSIPQEEVIDSEGKTKFKDNRGRCVVCCELCQKGKCVGTEDKSRVRLGRKTHKYCPTCQIHLCKHCHGPFHSGEPVELPTCHPCHGMDQVRPPRGQPTPDAAALRRQVAQIRNPPGSQQQQQKARSNKTKAQSSPPATPTRTTRGRPRKQQRKGNTPKRSGAAGRARSSTRNTK